MCFPIAGTVKRFLSVLPLVTYRFKAYYTERALVGRWVKCDSLLSNQMLN